jgi:hypothetical protein
MKLELQTKLELKDLLKAMEYLGKSISSSDDIHTYSKSPIHILLHNEILKYSKEEIDACKEKIRWNGDLFESCFRIRNPYIFSAFMKVGAFQDKISNDTKWLLKQENNPSNDLYELMYYVEDAYRDKKHNDDEEYKGGILFSCLFDRYAHYLDAEKFKIIDSYFKTFGKRKEKDLLEFICNNHGRRSELCDYLVVKLKNNNVDLSQNSFMNNLLPKEESWHGEDKKFFISSSDMPRITKLLECGFRFNEKEYSFHGDNLFIAIVKSGEQRLIKPILPYLTDVISQSANLIEQHQFIESLNKIGNKHTDVENIKFIQTLYSKCLLDVELGANNKVNQKKIKI